MSFPWAKHYAPSNGFTKWIDERLPLPRLVYGAVGAGYPVPRNLNYFWNFGVLAGAALGIQMITGIVLAMHYAANGAIAFDSVEHIMRDVNSGWFLRYAHANGASMFFIVVYIHIFRGLFYGSYKAPREMIWLLGVTIFLLIMATSFMGYVLPWGQMSFWGAQVIVNIFSAIPFIGPELAVWIRGDYSIGDATLNRFFAFHVVALPLVLIGLVAAHILALHEVGSNNPDGIEIKKNKDPKTGIPLDGIAFHPYYTVKDIVGVVVFLMIFTAIIFFMPEMGGYFLEYNNFVPADPLKTPAHIAPVWYFTPYYSILRAVPPMFGSQFPGVIAMGLSTMIFFALPWLDRGAVKSIRYRGNLYKSFFAMFIFCFIVLGYLGVKPTSVWGQFGDWASFMDTKEIATWGARLLTIGYFAFFFLMPWYTKADKTKPEPSRVTFGEKASPAISPMAAE